MVCVRSFRTKDGSNAETLFRRSADERSQESDGGQKPPECCEAVADGRFKRDQIGAAPFGHGVGRSEPDGLAPRAEAGGAPVLDP